MSKVIVIGQLSRVYYPLSVLICLWTLDLLNHKANFYQILQEYSLDHAVWKVFKDVESKQNSGCYGNNIKVLKKSCQKNPWPDF